MQLGIGSGLIEDIQNRKYHEPEYHEKLVRYYADWINENDDKLTTNAFLITLTTWLAIYGVVMLVLGVASPLLEFIPKVSFIVVTVSVAALALLSMTDKL
ncbi:hypothetical protein [Halorussus ruber]|uniref:hypothetical protein n=1 Tax=Halorussus ruber TaxID=1126238 RepID=UPI001091F56C|nr:hypothetical protein [Halorussus ruber]